MAFIEKPVLDLRINETCLLSSIVVLITFKSFKRKIGLGLPVPNGSNFFISV